MVATKTLKTITIDGRSMIPVLIPNDIVKIESLRTEPIVGNIVVYYSEGKLVIHRVIKRNKNMIVTRGDNCDNEDTPIPIELIVATLSERKTSIVQRIKWVAYYIKKNKWKKGWRILVSCVKKIK